MKRMSELKKRLEEELDELAGRNDMSMTDLDAIQKLTSSIKNIAKIEAMGQEEECEDYEEHMTERLGEMMKEDNLSQREREVLEVAMKMLK